MKKYLSFAFCALILLILTGCSNDVSTSDTIESKMHGAYVDGYDVGYEEGFSEGLIEAENEFEFKYGVELDELDFGEIVSDNVDSAINYAYDNSGLYPDEAMNIIDIYNGIDIETRRYGTISKTWNEGNVTEEIYLKAVNTMYYFYLYFYIFLD